jgi:subtilase family serine protease
MESKRIRVPAVSRLVTLSMITLGMVTLTLTAPGIAAGQNWVSTGTQAVGPVRANAISQGNLPDATPIHVNVGLQIKNRDALVNYVKRISTPGDALYQEELEPANFVATYAPSTAQVQSVVSYLTGAGFQNVQIEPNNLMVSADGTAAAVRTAFNTQLGAYMANGVPVYANLSPAQVPEQLGGIVSAVLGLNNAAKMSVPLARNAVSVPNFPGSYRPKDLLKAYDVGSTPTGSKTAIAIFAEGDVSGVVKDLRLVEKNNGLPQVPVKIVQVGLASPDTAGADEWDLDTQYSSGMATNLSTLYIYTTTLLLTPMWR